MKHPLEWHMRALKNWEAHHKERLDMINRMLEALKVDAEKLEFYLMQCETANKTKRAAFDADKYLRVRDTPRRLRRAAGLRVGKDE